jgi:hypothetical protein
MDFHRLIILLGQEICFSGKLRLMIRRFAAIFTLMVLASCALVPNLSDVDLEGTTNSSEPEDGSEPADEAEPTDASITLEKATITPTSDSDCLGSEKSEIGQEIADEFDEIGYDQIMIWFCNGAEFDDISLALLTEQETDASAEEMLFMLADGLSWNDIWLLVGLTE